MSTLSSVSQDAFISNGRVAKNDHQAATILLMGNERAVKFFKIAEDKDFLTKTILRVYGVALALITAPITLTGLVIERISSHFQARFSTISPVDAGKSLKKLPFEPRYTLVPFDPVDSARVRYQAVKEKIALLPSDLKIYCDDACMGIHFGYDHHTIRALGKKYSVIDSMIGNGDCTVFDGYVSTRWQTRYNFNRNPIVEKAKSFFQNIILPKKITVATLEQPINAQDLLATLLENAPGIAIGEYHNQVSSKEFLCQQMQHLVAHGVDTIYMEHLIQDGLQEDLDSYFSGRCDELPSALAAYLKKMDEGYLTQFSEATKTYTDLIVSAKKAKLKRVVCIDTELSYGAGSSKRDGVSDTEARCLAMNYQAKLIIDKEKAAGKFIVFTGAFHATSCSGVPGMAQILGCPSLLITTATNPLEKGIEQDFVETVKNEKITLNFDFHLRH